MYVPTGAVGNENLNKAKTMANPFLCLYHMLYYAAVKIWV